MIYMHNHCPLKSNTVKTILFYYKNLPNNTHCLNLLFSKLSFKRQLLKIVESWQLPGHLATTFIIFKCELHMNWPLIEKYPFLFRKISGSSPPIREYKLKNR